MASRHRASVALLAALTASVVPGPGAAQARGTTVSEALAGLEALARTLPASGQINASLARMAVDSLDARAREWLTAPATLNRALGRVEGKRGLKGVLAPLQLHFASVETTDGRSLLGLQYAWTRDFAYDSIRPFSARFFNVRGTAKANGFVAFANENPRDFLDSELSLGMFGVWGGTLPPESGWFDRLNALEDSLATFTSLDAMRASGLFDTFFGQVWSRLTTQVYLDADLAASLETSQDFKRTQKVVGGHVGLDVKAWNPSSALARANVFDWPAAVLRYLLGSDDGVHPRGSAIPTLVVGLGRVDPDGDVARAAVGAKDPFYRLSADLTYRSPLAPMAGGSLYLEAWARLYHELDAPAPVKTARLDDFREATVLVRAPNGMYVAYSAGKLPLDQEGSRLFHVGFQYSFRGSAPGG